MFGGVLQAFFLYFPEDKTEYIPAVITTAIFTVGAFIATRLFIIQSRKEAEEAKKIEERLLQDEQKKV